MANTATELRPAFWMEAMDTPHVAQKESPESAFTPQDEQNTLIHLYSQG
jgi:hypothetical protein